MEKDTVKDLKILILLNAWDGIISYIGVFTKNIEEWNPFMRNIVSDIRLLAAVKIIVPTLIIITIIFLINSGGYSPSKAVKKIDKNSFIPLYSSLTNSRFLDNKSCYLPMSEVLLMKNLIAVFRNIGYCLPGY